MTTTIDDGWDAVLDKRRRFPHAYYAFNSADPIAVLGQGKRRLEYESWLDLYAAFADDFDSFLRHGRKLLGQSRSAVQAMFPCLRILQDLPTVRRLQEDTANLTPVALRAITEELELCTNYREIVGKIDRDIAVFLTPRLKGQNFPTPAQIRGHMRQLLKEHGAESANPEPEPKRQKVEIIHDWDEWSYLAAQLDRATMIRVEATLREHAKVKECSLRDAFVDLLTGGQPPKVFLNVYRAHDLDGEVPGWVPDQGWLDPETIAALLDGAHVTTRDMDQAAQSETAAYQTPPAMRAYVIGRDGGCRYPGHDHARCDWSQMDHRINHKDGGKTTPGNLAGLCQSHHNDKTNGQSFYVMDPQTGTIVWLHEDGTWEIDEASGPLSPTGKAWLRRYHRRQREQSD